MCDCDCELNKYVKWAEIRREDRAATAKHFEDAANLSKELLKGTSMVHAISGTLMGAADFVSPDRCTMMCKPEQAIHTYEKGCIVCE